MNAYKLYVKARKNYEKGNIRLARIITKLNNLIHNSYIPFTAEIGDNTNFAYNGIGVVIHARAKIGKNCTIGQNCTIGGRTGHGGPPKIGDNVYIAAGTRLLGDFVVGANSVVISDVPNNCVVAGVPAKIIKRDVSQWQNENVI